MALRHKLALLNIFIEYLISAESTDVNTEIMN